jgi:hypothetical protein
MIDKLTNLIAAIPGLKGAGISQMPDGRWILSITRPLSKKDRQAMKREWARINEGRCIEAEMYQFVKPEELT